jgi:hypothetical protein
VADRARAELRELLNGEVGPSQERDERIADSAAAVTFERRPAIGGSLKLPGSTIKWGPLFLTLAAGSLVIWHGKKPQVHRQPPAPRDALRVSLFDAPGLRDAPWVQHGGDGVRRELDFRQGSTLLREDSDGDGLFETEYAVQIVD